MIIVFFYYCDNRMNVLFDDFGCEIYFCELYYLYKYSKVIINGRGS